VSRGPRENLFRAVSMHLTAVLEEVDSEVVVGDVVEVAATTAAWRRVRRLKIAVTEKVSMTQNQRRSHVVREVVTTEVVEDAGVAVEGEEVIAADQEPAAKVLETSLALMEMIITRVIAMVKVIVVREVDVEATPADDHDDSADVHDALQHRVLETKEVGTAITTTAVINTRMIDETGMTPAVVVTVGIVGIAAIVVIEEIVVIEIEVSVVIVEIVGIVIAIGMVATVMMADRDVVGTAVTGKL